jgi:hypothetical protein
MCCPHVSKIPTHTFSMLSSVIVESMEWYSWTLCIRRVWRYQRGNQNPYIEEEQTTQWPKEKRQKDKQWSTKHSYKTKDRVTRTPLKIRGELRCCPHVSKIPTHTFSMLSSVIVESMEWYSWTLCIRRVWRYQRGNQNPYIEEEQTTQWQTTIYNTYI